MIDLCTAGRGIKRVIGGEPVRFPARWSRYYESNYEQHTFNFLRAHCASGDTVMDIGAHLGLFSVFMARLVGPSGRVFSFEPTPLTRKTLQKTVRINGCENSITVRGEAVAGSTTTMRFYDTGMLLSNANSIIHSLRSRRSLTVKTVSLDDFVATYQLNVRCLKIDVEGAELELLRGACRTFLIDRPAAALSVHPAQLNNAGYILADVWSVLEEYNMSVRLLTDNKRARSQIAAIDKAWFCRQQDVFDIELLPMESASTRK